MVHSLVALLIVCALHSGAWANPLNQNITSNVIPPIALPEDVHTTVIGESTESKGHRGCFMDADTKSRDLPQLGFDAATNTIEKCRVACQRLGFRFAGVQYSRLCFCGNSFGRLGKSENCTMKCSGNDKQTCGGYNANNVYDVPEYVELMPVGPSQHYGCFRDNQTRDVPYLAYDAGYNTIEQCRIICKRLLFKYAAVQETSRCYCGNNFGRYGRADNCNMKCSGNDNEICGGAFANNVYVVPGFVDPEYFESIPEGPSQHYGCYRDNQTRDLPYLAYDSTSNTIEQCRNACERLGFKYAAVQFRSNCFCGFSFGSYGRADNCDMKCSGNNNQTCGGAYANNIFGVRGYVEPKSEGELQFFGCFKDNENFRDLPHLAYEGNNTIEKCKLACQIHGFRFAAVQSGNKCFCGNSFGRYGKAAKCDMTCSSNNEQTCGAYLTNSVFSAAYVKPIQSKHPHLGCFRDKKEVRDLPQLAYIGSNSIAKCISACSALGMNFAAVQYSSHCFCGQTYGEYGVADNCNMRCYENHKEICGGAWANNVYYSGPRKPFGSPLGK